MSTMTWTREAKCKDCKFHQFYGIGRAKRTKCVNPKSPQFEKRITLNDFVCDKWEL